ncbi:MAG: sugar nucleotide-binding protein, partial [Acidobacteria bacterium]|nr:sugar nucleotide-binding protein [Acidobacteriota bacterium]
LYHCVNSGQVTWYDFACEVARLLGVAPRLRRLTTEEAGLKVSRPRYCALSNARLANVGIAMPSWQEALRRHLLQRT